MSTTKTAELAELVQRQDEATWIANLWLKYYHNQSGIRSKWKEINEYVTATDTNTTMNSSLPWTHTSTIPKLTQIRDNLHSNYISSIFPNDKWLRWEAYDKEAASKVKSEKIRWYMENKTRMGKFKNKMSLCVLDYIDTGNCYSFSHFSKSNLVKKSGRPLMSYTGPLAGRISPRDIVFDPTVDFNDSWKIVRSYKAEGEIAKMIAEDPSKRDWQVVLDRRARIRKAAADATASDWDKTDNYYKDGFGSLHEYYGHSTMEVLEFMGDIHDIDTGMLKHNRIITVVDRSIVVRDEEIDTPDGKPLIRHTKWRSRPDNTIGMGPLENLVGLQYMIDHYHNMAANALDLKVMPPKKVVGEVEAFQWAPNTTIHMDENGDVIEMAQQFGDIYALRDWIQDLEYRMELYAGAPREAMGIRTPGEKTAFEVQSLENAAGRIFQEKVVQFELFMEDVLNDMLWVAHNEMAPTDQVRIIDNDIGVAKFVEVTQEDIASNGIIRPVGARNFAQRAQELQNLMGLANSPAVWEKIGAHISGVELAKYVEDAVNLKGYNVFQKNVAVAEAQEVDGLANAAQMDNAKIAEQQEMLNEDEANATPF